MNSNNWYKIISVCLCIFYFTILSGCTNKSKDDIITGKWKIEDMDVGRKLTDAEKARLNSSYIEFNADSTFKVNRAGATRTGKWQLSADKTMLLINDGVNEQELTIESITEDRFVVSEDIEGEKRIMTMTPE